LKLAVFRKNSLHAMLRQARNGLLGAVLLLLVAPHYLHSEQTPNFARLSQQADQAREANDLDQAVQLYRKALALRPRWADGWWWLGTIYYDRNAYSDAAYAFQRLVPVDPNNGRGQLMLGLCQFELGQDDAALKSLQAGRRFGVPKDRELWKVVLYHEGLLFLRQSKFSSAQEALALLAGEDVEEENARLALGMSVLLVRPENAPLEGSTGHEIILRVGQAETLAVAKKFDEAKKAYADALAMGKDFPNLHYAYGRFLLQFDETDEAVTQFRQDIQDNPRHVQSYLEIAAVRYRVDSPAGVKYAETAVTLDPHLPFGHYLLGMLYLDTGEYEKSIAELEIAKKSFAEKPDVYFALGNAYTRLGRKEEAARAWARFKRLSVQNGKTDSDTDESKPRRIRPPRESDESGPGPQS
jgi:tetratricopeptide (TPR) repeat protein